MSKVVGSRPDVFSCELNDKTKTLDRNSIEKKHLKTIIKTLLKRNLKKISNKSPIEEENLKKKINRNPIENLEICF